MEQQIFIVDDDPKIGNMFSNVLTRDGFDVDAFLKPAQMLDRMDEETEPDIILADMMMPDMNGVELLETLNERHTSIPVIVMTGNASVSLAVEAMQKGAFHYLEKPINLEEMRALIDQALDLYDEEEEVEELRQEQHAQYPVDGILGESASIEEVRETVRTLESAPKTTVLLSGETGTGKNLVAKTIHHNSPHAKGRFMEINCAALPDNLLEAELFGYEKGAFTDARESKEGLLEAADGGTVFLDEIDSMSMALQAKLLSFLESRVFRRLGGVEDLRVSTRVLCATNSDIEASVSEGSFRKDLYFRINVVNLHLPPLRRMGEDVLIIAEAVVDELNREMGREAEGFTEAAREKLMNYAWPGNVRELRNVLERAMIFFDGPLLEADDLELGGTEGLSSNGVVGGATDHGSFHFPEGASLEELERAYILHTLKGNDASYAQIARQLGISKKTLWEKRRRYDLDEEVER
jgi:DNA-binding NtrC family response regulator